MKRLSLFTLFMISSFGVSAQQHEIPFPDSNAIWMMETYIPPDPADPSQQSSTCYSQFFSHDTSHVNGMVYTNLYIDFNQSGFDFMFEDDMSNYLKVGQFRVENQQVYYQNLIPQAFEFWYDCYTGYHGGNLEYEEFLMYDFDLEVGDTFQLTTSTSTILESIDSVLIEGSYYRKFNFDFRPNYYWIEGIGSSIGFFPYFDFFESYLNFNCLYEDYNNFTYYPNGENCGYLDIEEIQIKPPKTLLKIIDIMGRETEGKPNTLLFFMYSDGTTEKIYRVE